MQKTGAELPYATAPVWKNVSNIEDKYGVTAFWFICKKENKTTQNAVPTILTPSQARWVFSANFQPSSAQREL